MNPYIMPMQQAQDVSGLLPIYQAIGQQQAMQNAALAQQNQLMNQVGQTLGGFNPAAMAQMLRGKPATGQEMAARDVQMAGLNTYNPYTQYQVSSMYGTNPYSQQSRMLASQEF